MTPVDLPRSLATLLARSQVALTLASAEAGGHPLVLVNAPFLELSGYREEQVIGRDCRLLQGDRPQPIGAREAVRRALRDGLETVVHLRNVDARGRPFDNLLFLHPLLDDGGRLRFVLGSQYDVTRPVLGASVEDHAAALEVFIEAANSEVAKAGGAPMSTLGRISGATARLARNAMFMERRLRRRGSA